MPKQPELGNLHTCLALQQPLQAGSGAAGTSLLCLVATHKPELILYQLSAAAHMAAQCVAVAAMSLYSLPDRPAAALAGSAGLCEPAASQVADSLLLIDQPCANACVQVCRYSCSHSHSVPCDVDA